MSALASGDASIRGYPRGSRSRPEFTWAQQVFLGPWLFVQSRWAAKLVPSLSAWQRYVRGRTSVYSRTPALGDSRPYRLWHGCLQQHVFHRSMGGPVFSGPRR